MSNLIAFLLLGLAACCLLPTMAHSLIAQTKNSAATKSLPPAQPSSNRSDIQQVQGTRDGRTTVPGRASVRDDADQPPASGQRENRPQPQGLRIAAPSPELWKVLKDWEVESAKVKRLTGAFRRFTYDDTFEFDKRAEGSFVYEAPDKGNYEVRGAPPAKGEESRKKNAKGQPYEIVADKPERWVCTGQEVIRIDEEKRTYEKVAIPEDERGQNIIDGPLPFLFGMKADQAVRRYKMELLQHTEAEIWLDVEPRTARDAANWKRAKVIIDATAFLPKAVQMLDPTGNKTTVHTFSDLEVNRRNGLFSGDPFQPKLSGYKLVLPPAANSAPNTGAGDRATSLDRELPRTAANPPVGVSSSRKNTSPTIRK
jgi:TIGR03009 family protein